MVFPWVPVTAMVLVPDASPASACARIRTGMPRSRAAVTSGSWSGIAEEITTTSADPIDEGSCPT